MMSVVSSSKAWICHRRTPRRIILCNSKAVEHHPFPEWQRLLFHIDEGMSWESVRNLDHTRSTLLLIRDIATPVDVPEAVTYWIDAVWQNLEDVFAGIAEGDIR
jgi:hypothetical protein